MATPFDPDAYLAEQPSAFDPDGYLDAPSAPASPLETSFGTKVRQFFDPTYPSPSPPSLGGFAKQGAKAAAMLIPGGGAASLLASGALFGAGTSDADNASGLVKDAGVGAVSSLLGGKLLQGVIKGTLWPAAQQQALRSTFGEALDPAKPILQLVPKVGGLAVAPVPAAATSMLETTTEPAVGGVVKAVTGTVQPTPAAQRLLKKGVRLTRGQQNPASEVNQLEEAMTSTFPHGSSIKAQRGVGIGDLQIVALNEAIPPGMKPIKIGTEFTAAVGAVDDGFARAYGSVADVPVYPAVHGAGGGPLQGTGKTPGLVEQAVGSVQRLTRAQNKAVTRDVLDLLTKLPPRKGAVGQVDASDLIDVRSVIRSRARDYWQDGTAESSAIAEAYEAAESALTAALESQLPADLVRTLRKTDAAYAKFKTVQKAIQAGKSQPGGFTPRQLANAAAAGQSGVNIGARDLGPLYDLGIAGADVFQQVSPPTGARLVTLTQAGKFLPKWMPDAIVNRAVGGAIQRGNQQAMTAVPMMINRNVPPPGLPPWQTPSAPGAGVPVTVDALKSLIDALQNRVRIGPVMTPADEGGR